MSQMESAKAVPLALTTNQKENLPSICKVAPSAIWFGPLGEETYLHYAPKQPNDPEYAIKKLNSLFSSSAEGPNAARLSMWEKYESLLLTLENIQGKTIIEAAYTFLTENFARAAKEFTPPTTKLAQHLEQISNFCQSFFVSAEGHSRYPQVISDRKALLLAYVAAPMHDIAKYLGSRESQIRCDHEIMTAELIRRTCEGKKVFLAGKETTLEAADINFISEIIGDHENLEKELDRRDRITSKDETERAKALFFMADVLAGVLVETPSGSNNWQIDAKQLDARYTDLVFRHIDPVKGKICRPVWIEHTHADLQHILEVLESQPNSPLKIGNAGLKARKSLTVATIRGIDLAFTEDNKRNRDARLAKKFSPDKSLSKEVYLQLVCLIERLK